jgi:hypothetical protein
MLDDQLCSSRNYINENEYDSRPPMPIILEQTVAGDVYSLGGNKGTLKFRVSLRT